MAENGAQGWDKYGFPGDVAIEIASSYVVIGMLLSVVLVTGLMVYLSRDADRPWTQTTAKVAASFVTRDCASTASRNRRGTAAKDWDKNCPRIIVPHIRYAYEADGRKYTGESLSFNQVFFASTAEGDAWVKEHRPGSSLPIFYNPEDPGESAVFRDRKKESPLLLIVSVLLLAGAIGLRIRRSTQKNP